VESWIQVIRSTWSATRCVIDDDVASALRDMTASPEAALMVAASAEARACAARGRMTAGVDTLDVAAQLPDGSTVNSGLPEKFSAASGSPAWLGHACAMSCDQLAAIATAGVVSMQALAVVPTPPGRR
jgi:hypothetical protein